MKTIIGVLLFNKELTLIINKSTHLTISLYLNTSLMITIVIINIFTSISLIDYFILTFFLILIPITRYFSSSSTLIWTLNLITSLWINFLTF